MTRSAYVFRMWPDERQLLDSLSSHYRSKRDTLAAALRALNSDIRESEAGNQPTRERLLERLCALEPQVAELSLALKPKRKRSQSSR